MGFGSINEIRIQKWLMFRKFKWSFNKAAKAQARHEKVLKGEKKNA